MEKNTASQALGIHSGFLTSFGMTPLRLRASLVKPPGLLGVIEKINDGAAK
jgi:hypothetical protein